MEKEQKSIHYILFALIVAFLPETLKLPIWVTFWCLLLWTYAYLIEKGVMPKPKKWLSWILPLVGFSIVLFTFRTLGGSAYVALLAIMASLKPLEIKTHRDKVVTIFIAYFLIITSLFDFESLSMTVYMFISVLIVTTVLIRINNPASTFRHHMKTSAVIM